MANPQNRRFDEAHNDKKQEISMKNRRGLRIVARTEELGEDHVRMTTRRGRWRHRSVAYTEGMALSDTTVYVSVPHDNALCLVSRDDGKVTKIDLPTPRGLAFRGGKLFVVSGTKLLRLSAEGKVEGTMVDGGGLKNPSSLAVDS
jgi:hypothetical protein